MQKNEKQTLHYIKTQLKRPDTILYRVEKLNTSFGKEKGVFAPAATMDNRFMITSTQTDSVASDINPYHNRLFNSTFTDGSLQIIGPVSFQSIDSSLSQGAACISANGNHIYLTQWRKGVGSSHL